MMRASDLDICSTRIHQACHLLLLLFTLAATSSAQQLPIHSTSAPGAQSRGVSRSPETNLLLALVPDDDPFVSAESVGYTGLLPALFQFSTSAEQQPPHDSDSTPLQTGSGTAHGNATHSFRFSHTMQMNIPQPWDTINMSVILRDNLEQDLLFWQQLEYIPSVHNLFDQALNHPQIKVVPHTRRLVEIKNNVLRFPLMPQGLRQYQCDELCDPQLADWMAAMHYAVHVLKLTLPDVLFIINTDDAPICNQEQVVKRECTVPMISLSKAVHMADLIAPVMKRSDATVMHRFKPWEDKKDMAFFRGVPSCGDMPFPPLCARSLVARLAQVNYSHILDAGLVEEYDRPDQVAGDPVLRDGNGSLPVLPRESMSVLPNYKYLLNLDGHVAAYRLAQLLATNSLVLKQHSSMVEYYYRSLRPFHHYVPIFKASEHDFIPRLHWAMTHEDIARHIVSNANHFALTYTTYKARIYYWKYVLMAYKKIFSDQDHYFMPPAEPETPMEVLLKQQLAALQTQQRQQQQT